MILEYTVSLVWPCIFKLWSKFAQLLYIELAISEREIDNFQISACDII